MLQFSPNDRTTSTKHRELQQQLHVILRLGRERSASRLLVWEAGVHSMAASLAVGTGERAPLCMVTTHHQPAIRASPLSVYHSNQPPNGRNQLMEERQQEQQARIVN